MPITDFTFEAYFDLIKHIKERGFYITNYFNVEPIKKCIIRHDVDFDIETAKNFSTLEKNEGISSTYFILLKTDFYNPISIRSIESIKKIIENGHDIGLHFDEKSYFGEFDFVNKVRSEIVTLSDMLEYEIKVVSMHRPSASTLMADYKIPNIVNSYSDEFFKKYKYFSDSRKNWREDVENLIDIVNYDNIHLLTHPIWYHKMKTNIKDDLLNLINNGKNSRYCSLNDNFTDLSSIIKTEDFNYEINRCD